MHVAGPLEWRSTENSISAIIAMILSFFGENNYHKRAVNNRVCRDNPTSYITSTHRPALRHDDLSSFGQLRRSYTWKSTCTLDVPGRPTTTTTTDKAWRLWLVKHCTLTDRCADCNKTMWYTSARYDPSGVMHIGRIMKLIWMFLLNTVVL